MKWAWGILVTSDFLRLLSKQPSRRKGRVALPHFLSPNLLQKGVICQFYCIKKSTQKHIVQTNVFFQAKHVENATELMPESSHSANWLLVTPIPVACCGWGDFLENHVGLCAHHNPLKITSDWNMREATPSFPLRDTSELESSSGRCKGTVIKNKRERVVAFLAWFFFFPSSFLPLTYT